MGLVGKYSWAKFFKPTIYILRYFICLLILIVDPIFVFFINIISIYSELKLKWSRLMQIKDMNF